MDLSLPFLSGRLSDLVYHIVTAKRLDEGETYGVKEPTWFIMRTLPAPNVCIIIPSLTAER